MKTYRVFNKAGPQEIAKLELELHKKKSPSGTVSPSPSVPRNENHVISDTQTDFPEKVMVENAKAIELEPGDESEIIDIVTRPKVLPGEVPKTVKQLYAHEMALTAAPSKEVQKSFAPMTRSFLKITSPKTEDLPVLL